MNQPTRCALYIDGRFTQAGVANWIEVRNPANGEVVAQAPDAGQDLIDAAVDAASCALRGWRRSNPFERSRLLHAIGEELARDEQAIALAITIEMGKPLAEAQGEARKLAKAFHYYAEEAVRIFGETVPNEEDGYTSFVEKEPVGVVAAIAPWNYPVELIGWKLAAALAAGCTIVVKPSEYTPSSAEAVFRCVDRAGLPAGVANLVMGAREAGRRLVGHPAIDKVAFTGSGPAGEDIYRTVRGITGLSLELGGSCPLIVTAHADLERAVSGTLRRAFRNAGQICISINRAYVEASVHDRFVEKLAEGARRLVVADGLANPRADVGPMATRAGLDKVRRHVDDARERGARLLCGGARPDTAAAPEAGAAGLFYSPTVLVDCRPEMLVMHEETFGPVIGVSAYDSLDQAIEAANGTPAGLAAYAYTEHVHETFRLARELDFGNVAINNVDAGIMNAAYGGRKQSGSGYEHGREGMEGYLHLKHVRLRHGA
ncbi:aldehyde dehydrogenase family protein [Burkholderia gladioli]|uniref:aldehyde dehydrogenase family protein n=1 Tax=Burkholderia gladioli TaxID=28095 RepID=UPI00163ED2B7|nr:aldehyde dehydrogenase family protein [Burkholderia gladioli]MBU9217986.1 aldehyde dehydrogenase family protein [Burkholderia gladioli]MDN7726920.1 aldehyde dehydrogenase family protein [Burkholderia gladioli]MDN7803036.1 aldehyde dehydrogenase family protein [Burkholderia gladioli]